MKLINRFLPRVDFDSYEDFIENYKLDVPDNFNFGFDVVDAWAAIEPEKRALVWCDDSGDEKTFTFADMSLLSNRAANWLVSLGVKKADPVMLILRRRWEYWVLAVAIHKIGAAVIPASLQLTSKDISYRVGAADIKMLISIDDAGVMSQINEAGLSIPLAVINTSKEEKTYHGYVNFDLNPFPDTFARPEGGAAAKNTDTMLIYFTSGTTGMPKMVKHDFTHPLGQIVTAKYWQQVQEDKLHLTVSDSGWAKFGWGKIYGQWICGAVIFCYDMDKFVPKNLLQKIQDYKITTFCAPPTMYRFMLQEDLTQYDLSCVKHCGNAGEPLNPDVYKKFYSLTGLSLREGFGQSESSVLVANFMWLTPRPGSMGKPAPLYDIDLLDADGKPCEAGVEGEIVIRAADKACGLFKGYHKDNEYNAKVFRDGCYFTGDVAWRDDDGYYWFIGRNDDVIKCSGYRIGPFEVESALIEHPAVVECAVTAAPDDVRGQVVKASVVLAAGFSASPELVRQLQEHVKKVTAPYKYPRIVEFVDELPKTVSGKIKRGQIRMENDNNIKQSGD